MARDITRTADAQCVVFPAQELFAALFHIPASEVKPSFFALLLMAYHVGAWNCGKELKKALAATIDIRVKKTHARKQSKIR
ncbi:MAG: hypothetical protein K6G15_08715 [Desulfovibrio sp.]|nr:hypothetical protein [Desulfovibrio sp.]